MALVALLLLVVAALGHRRWRLVQVGPAGSCYALGRWHAAVVASPSGVVHGLVAHVVLYIANGLHWLLCARMHLQL